MRHKLLLGMLFLNGLFMQSQEQKVCTFNIKFDNPSDGVHQWDNRKEHIVNFVKMEDIDVMGMQEVLHSQIEYLEQNLSDYHRVGVGRDDGMSEGEYSPIFFKKERYQLIESNTFWLSPDTNKPGKGWDAALPRICTWVKLYDRESKDTILYLNTHFDHVGVQARQNSVDVIIKAIEELNHTGKVVLMGDFNLEPDTEPIQKIVQSGFTDSFEAPLKLGPKGTYNAFQITGDFTRRIDFIFLKNAEATSYKTNSMVIDHTFLSDHFPVVIEIW